MKELIPVDLKNLQVGLVYFLDGILVRFKGEEKNTKSSYYIFEPLPGQRTKARIKLSQMRLKYFCFEASEYNLSASTTQVQAENTQLSLF